LFIYLINTFKQLAFCLDCILYVKKSLAIGKSLLNILLKTFDFQKGKAITFLPAEVSVDAAKQFTTGGKLAQATSSLTITPTPTSVSLLVSEIATFLKARQRRSCIMENALAKPSDPYLAPFKNKILTFGEEVYHYLLPEDAQDETISKAVKVASSYLFIGALSSLPQAITPTAGVVALDILKEYAARAEKIIVGAYDGEGYVICGKEE